MLFYFYLTLNELNIAKKQISQKINICLFDNEYINMVAMVLVGIAGSIIIMHIIKKGILSVLMFGKK